MAAVVISEVVGMISGSWSNPYSRKVFLNAAEMDINHLVHLAWAW